MTNRNDVVLLLGTRKGAFILSAAGSRTDWLLDGPHAPGSDVFHMAYDTRDGSILAAVNHLIWGPEVQVSRDMGRTWEHPKEQMGLTGDTGRTLQRVWHVEPGRASEPGVVYAGAEPGGLLKSEDGGATWSEVVTLSGHPTRDAWQPGAGGLCLHSVVLDPTDTGRMWVGISAVGVFGTEDAGESWQTMNRGVRADFLPDPVPEFGNCPHKLLGVAGMPSRLYQQNHCGVYRSDDAGQNWTDITGDLPSRFGFVLGLNPGNPDTLFVVPEDGALGTDVGGGNRIVTDAKFRVFRSTNAGADWEPLTKGLPQQHAYLHCMREGMATDGLDPCGIYVGTTTGQVFHSRDNGDSWELLIDHLPPINSVECGAVS